MQKNTSQYGFSTVEIIAALFVLTVIAGATVFVITKKDKPDTKANTTTYVETKRTVSKPGTSGSIDDLTANDANAEDELNSKYEAIEQSDAASTNESLQAIGDAYDESSL